MLALLLAAALSAPLPAAAQFSDVSVQWAPTAGINLATLRTDTADVASETTFAGGLLLHVDVPGPVSLQPELLFVQKGAAVGLRNGDGEVRYTGNYIELPLTLHVNGPRIGPVRPHLALGGYGSVKIFERQSAGGGEISFPLESDVSFYNRTDAGVHAGLGARFTAGGGGRLGIELRYSRGLVDVTQELSSQPFSEAPFPADGQTETWMLFIRFGL